MSAPGVFHDVFIGLFTFRRTDFYFSSGVAGTWSQIGGTRISKKNKHDFFSLASFVYFVEWG